VQQPRDEALAIFRNINTRFLYILLFTVLVVVFLSFFVSWYLSKPLIEVDPHLEQL
jgi:bacteriorhodopsin